MFGDEADFLQQVRAIYRAHGWPYSFRREECKKALKEWDNQ